MRRIWLHVGVSTLLVLGLTAFAGGSDTDEFRSDADEICTDAAEQTNEVLNELGVAQSVEDDVAITEALLPIREESLSQLEDLDPPRKLRSDYEDFLSLTEERIANDEAFLEAAAAGDQDAIESLTAEVQELGADRREVGRALGFKACAEKLPKKEEKKVRAVMEETVTEADPAFCTEKYTENFVESVGGLEACETAESDPANAADSIEIESVRGIAKIYAIVVLVPEGGPNDGQAGEFELVYVDGVYKREAIFAAPPAD